MKNDILFPDYTHDNPTEITAPSQTNHHRSHYPPIHPPTTFSHHRRIHTLGTVTRPSSVPSQLRKRPNYNIKTRCIERTTQGRNKINTPPQQQLNNSTTTEYKTPGITTPTTTAQQRSPTSGTNPKLSLQPTVISSSSSSSTTVQLRCSAHSSSGPFTLQQLPRLLQFAM